MAAPSSLGRMLSNTVAKHGSRNAFVTLGKEGRTRTYNDLWSEVKAYAAVLKALGLKRGDRLVLIAENSPEWGIVDWAAQCLGIWVVPIYASLPADQSAYIIRDSEAKVAICGTAELAQKVGAVDGVRTTLLKGPDSIAERATESSLSEPEIQAEIDLTNPEDPCTIIYTSGTTGTPKGALMPHRAFVHVAVAAKHHISLSENDGFLSFLPMSHVYERVAGQCVPIGTGAQITFSRGLASLANELKEAKPQVMFCVPRFLENMRDRILDAVAKDKPIRQKLFHLMLSQGTKRAKGEFAPLAGVLDKIVAAKVRERTGGKLRFFVSGGAALAPAVAEFYMAIGITVLQGYGLTETSGGSFINKVENNKYWTVGEPVDIETKIAEDGEILIRGAGNMLGYYKMPEETAKAIDPEGWFHTGDIGEFEGKSLKITDRKKDLLVLANGKNIAPQSIENRMKASELIQEIVVFGDGMDHCIALVIPNFNAVRAALGVGEGVLLSKHDGARQLVKKEIDRINKTLAPFEMVKKFGLLDNPLTIDGGELTPTLKVKRRVVKEKFATQLAELGM